MRWEVIRLYENGRRLPDNEIRRAVGIVADVRMHTVMRGTRVVSEAVMADCPHPYPPLTDPRLSGIAVLAVGIEGFEELMRDRQTIYLRQCWLCRDPRR